VPFGGGGYAPGGGGCIYGGIWFIAGEYMAFEKPQMRWKKKLRRVSIHENKTPFGGGGIPGG
jgi:hypothetical protein